MKYTNQALLNMISKTYNVAYRKPSIFKVNPGQCRVQGVAITELNEPEILLLAHGATDPDFYPLEEIVLTPAIGIAAAS